MFKRLWCDHEYIKLSSFIEHRYICRKCFKTKKIKYTSEAEIFEIKQKLLGKEVVWKTEI
jgi:hypothetical protein